MHNGLFKVTRFERLDNFHYEYNPYVYSIRYSFDITCVHCGAEYKNERSLSQRNEVLIDGYISRSCKGCSENRKRNYDYFDDWVDTDLLLSYLYKAIRYNGINKKTLFLDINMQMHDYFMEELLQDFVKYNSDRRNKSYEYGVDDDMFVELSLFRPATQRKIFDFLKLVTFEAK
jgi:hypothetical protein